MASKIVVGGGAMLLMRAIWKLIVRFLEVDAVFGVHGRTVL